MRYIIEAGLAFFGLFMSVVIIWAYLAVGFEAIKQQSESKGGKT